MRLGLSAFEWPSAAPDGDLSVLGKLGLQHRRVPYDLRRPAMLGEFQERQRLATARGIELQPVIIGVPRTRRYYPRDLRDVGAMQQVLRWVVPELPGLTWQPTNEPNDDMRFDLYAATVYGIGLVIKQEDATARVLAGGLKGFPTNPGSLAADEYTLRALNVRLGAGRHKMGEVVDAYAVHCYQRTPDEQAAVVRRLRDAVDAYVSQRGKPIWVTELGIYRPETFSDAATVAHVAATLHRFADPALGVEQVNWFGWRDHPDWQPPDFHGLLRADGSRKPLFDVFTDGLAA